MHGISVYSAILDAVHATNPRGQPKLDAPCTPESILNAVASLNGVERPR
jgi:xanthine dehydrogenase molybdopterin-binding subunit B